MLQRSHGASLLLASIFHYLLQLGAAESYNGTNLTRVRFSEELAAATQAHCLDAKPAGYFVRVKDPNRWVVFLQGGGLCVTIFDCLARKRTNLGSFDYWQEEYPELMPFSPSTGDKLLFSNYSQVWVPYCSGDMFLGTDTSQRWNNLKMSGHLIVNAVIDHVINTTSFGRAEEIILAGTSAGGIAAIHHTDWLAEKMQKMHLGKQPPRLTTVAVAGMFFPKGYPVLFEEFALGHTNSMKGFAAQYIHMFDKGFLQQECVQAHSTPADCFDISVAMPYVKGDLFIVENLFDVLQIAEVGLCPTCDANATETSLAGEFIRFFGARMNETLRWVGSLRSNIGIYAPSALDHDHNLMHAVAGYNPLPIKGANLKDTFDRWYKHRQPVQVIDHMCQNAGPCSARPDLRRGFVASALATLHI